MTSVMNTATFLKLGNIRPSPNGSLYRQIAAHLNKQIARGKLAVGTRLPPERELASQLGVNRLTLRQALQELESQGRLTRKHGSGWYVSEPVIERQAGKLFSFTIGLQKRGYRTNAKIVRCVITRVDPSIASLLKLRATARVYDLHRLRFINAEPVALERYALSAERFPDLDQHDLANRSIIYDVLEKEYGVAIANARQSLEPVAAGAYEARLLAVKVGAPLMLERRLSFDGKGNPVEYGADLYRGDRFRFVTEMASLEL
jgi:GntR family transcriptional regulator